MCLLSLPRKPTDQKPCIPQTSGTCDLSSLHYWSLLAGCSHPISHGALDVARSTGGASVLPLSCWDPGLCLTCDL